MPYKALKTSLPSRQQHSTAAQVSGGCEGRKPPILTQLRLHANVHSFDVDQKALQTAEEHSSATACSVGWGGVRWGISPILRPTEGMEPLQIKKSPTCINVHWTKLLFVIMKLDIIVWKQGFDRIVLRSCTIY